MPAGSQTADTYHGSNRFLPLLDVDSGDPPVPHKESRLGLMDVPLEIRERVYHFMLPENPQILGTRDLTAPLAPDYLIHLLRTSGRTRRTRKRVIEDLNFKKSKYNDLSPWMHIAAMRLPEELHLNKKIMYEASCVFVRESKFIFQGDKLDKVTLARGPDAAPEDPGFVGLQKYLGSFEADQGYANICRIILIEHQVQKWSETSPILAPFLERCTGLCELGFDLPRDHKYLSRNDFIKWCKLRGMTHIEVRADWGSLVAYFGNTTPLVDASPVVFRWMAKWNATLNSLIFS